jgi:hypothetical protein
MSSGFFVGAYWAARKESIDQCADRLHRFFVDLAACDPTLATWYEKGRSHKQALEKQAEIRDSSYLLSLLDRGRHRRDVGRTVMEELGFRVGLWNGGSENKTAGLNITCGLYWTSPNPNASMSNCLTLDLPEDLGELKHAERMACVLAAIAREWEPDWAGVISRDAMSARAFNAKAPFVDWMVFIPRKIDGVPAPSSVMQLENGSLIVVQPDPPAVNNAEAQERIRKIESILRQGRSWGQT